MAEIPIFKFNSFRERNNYSQDDEKTNSLLNKNSIFLKKIIENKVKERNLIKKAFENEIIKNKNNKYIKSHNSEILKNGKAENKYISPLFFIKNENISKQVYNNNYNERRNIKCSISKTQSNNKSKIFNYYRIPNNFSMRESTYTISSYQSKTNPINIINSPSEDDSHCLSINGKKMFSTASFKSLNNDSIYNSTNEKKVELFRNYNELKKKKEEIYNRKIKKSASYKKREILRIEKEKEIKENTLGIELNKKIFTNNKKIRKIPIRKTYLIKNNFSIEKKDNNYLLTDINSFINSSKSNSNNSSNRINNINESDKFSFSRNNNKCTNLYEKIEKEKSFLKNLFNINLNKKLKYDKILKKKDDNFQGIGIKKIFEKSKDKYLNIKYKEEEKEPLSSRRLKALYKLNVNIDKKKFVQEQLNDSLFISNDKILMIRIHSLKNINQIFSIKKYNTQNLKIDKNISIFLKNNLKLFLNYIRTNKNPIKYKKAKNKNILSAIKEEEEKSKAELTKSGSKIEEKEKNTFDDHKKEKKFKLSDLKKMIFHNNTNAL